MEAVRVAETGDVASLVRLIAELTNHVESQRGGRLLVSSRGAGALALIGVDSVEDLLHDENRHVLVGTLDKVVTGVAVCSVRILADRVRIGSLDACFVEVGARGVGLGQLLAETALRWFKEEGCEGVDGTALPGDRDGKGFFESSGFKARLITMHRTLD